MVAGREMMRRVDGEAERETGEDEADDSEEKVFLLMIIL